MDPNEIKNIKERFEVYIPQIPHSFFRLRGVSRSLSVTISVADYWTDDRLKATERHGSMALDSPRLTTGSSLRVTKILQTQNQDRHLFSSWDGWD